MRSLSHSERHCVFILGSQCLPTVYRRVSSQLGKFLKGNFKDHVSGVILCHLTERRRQILLLHIADTKQQMGGEQEGQSDCATACKKCCRIFTGEDGSDLGLSQMLYQAAAPLDVWGTSVAPCLSHTEL